MLRTVIQSAIRGNNARRPAGTHRTLLLGIMLVCGGTSLGVAGEPIEVASGEGTKRPRQPQAWIDEPGALHVVFGSENDIFYCRADDGGGKFTPSRKLPAIGRLSLGMRRGPRIAGSGQRLCVTAIGGSQGNGRDGELYAFVSIDRGRSWENPQVINDVPGSAREGLHHLAAGEKGKLCCVWLDLRNKRTEVMASISTDGGRTWAPDVLVYQSPDGSVCECCHPSAAYGANGELLIMWRNSLGGSRDMYLSSSSDGGKLFSSAKKLGLGTWNLDHCPMDGGSLAATSSGPFAIWRHDQKIHFCDVSSQREKILGNGEQPWIAATQAGPLAVWLDRRGGALRMQRPLGADSIQLADSAVDPVIVASSSGKGRVAAIWETSVDKKSQILCKSIDVK